MRTERALAIAATAAVALGVTVLLGTRQGPAVTHVDRAAGVTPPTARTQVLATHATPAPVTPRERVLSNRYPYIPPQCYTKTQGADGRVHNPCFTCHVESLRPNFVRDAELQLSYAFPEPARKNPWTNLFVDRRAERARISDAQALAYVRQDNYPTPGARSAEQPRYTPDAYFTFDEHGFDRAPDGTPTGWRTYLYHPLPGTFFPTNGSMGDALIRLPELFRQDEAGHEDLAVYALNLAVLEALVKNRDVVIPKTAERRYGVDLDGDGELAHATRVHFDWAPRHGRTMSFVGRAKLAQAAGEVHASAGLFPRGTEFLHTVRYLDVVDGEVTMARRLKELRYARKERFLNYGQLEQATAEEVKEDHDFPDRLRRVFGDAERGVLATGTGWRYQGMIEDHDGALRPQTFEELAYCVGCHGGIGATADTTFSFARKLDDPSRAHGWAHPSRFGYQGMPEPVRADGRYEYETYLAQAGAGDEFRSNDEVRARFFTADGALRPEAIATLHRDVSSLLLPTPARALELDKAYWLLVREQSYTRGREVTLAPPENVHRALQEEQPTGIEQPVTGPSHAPKPAHTSVSRAEPARVAAR